MEDDVTDGGFGRAVPTVLTAPAVLDALLVEVAELVAVDADEFTATLAVELVRRYRRMVRARVAGEPVAGVWRVVLDAAEHGVCWPRLARAAAVALIRHDVVLAAVSACTLMGCTPGPVQRDRAEALITHIIAGLVRRTGRPGAPGVALPGAPVSWTRVRRLWAVRGRPVLAAAERAVIDRLAELEAADCMVGPIGAAGSRWSAHAGRSGQFCGERGAEHGRLDPPAAG